MRSEIDPHYWWRVTPILQMYTCTENSLYNMFCYYSSVNFHTVTRNTSVSYYAHPM